MSQPLIPGKTSVGGRSENQDYWLYKANTAIGLIAVVCDGMGGAAGGQRASHLATTTILNELQAKPAGTDIAQAIVEAVKKANQDVYELASRDSSLRGMGTTVTVLVLNDKAAYLGHVGDSRIYQIRKGKSIYRTRDHSTVFKMLDEGILKNEEEARNHGRSNELLLAVGVRAELEVEINLREYRKGDQFLLCSDGICGEMDDKEILKHFSGEHSPKEIAENLVQFADEKGKQKGGGHDNMTAVVVEARSNGQTQSASPGKDGASGQGGFQQVIKWGTLGLVIGLVLMGLFYEFVRIGDLKAEVKETKIRGAAFKEELAKSNKRVKSLEEEAETLKKKKENTEDLSKELTEKLNSTEEALKTAEEKNNITFCDSLELSFYQGKMKEKKGEPLQIKFEDELAEKKETLCNNPDAK